MDRAFVAPFEQLPMPELNTLTYIAGYLARLIKSKLCDECEGKLAGQLNLSIKSSNGTTLMCTRGRHWFIIVSQAGSDPLARCASQLPACLTFSNRARLESPSFPSSLSGFVH
ncbi:hypothetical protein PoB_006647300 [Plakobranchus ocellatus]|uniref:Uncharacterized protein n=1 Tax=Plakobranchus ocellatus TaxID=259542 RepID=A0AAV4D7D9_9GAST|nr:hypothetical protein PoB_006647300 [Plakobranchus ocellatus]